ncbi:hypothetical protein JOC94_004286 [Bacillus thermophilus]|uniref:Uncharacterized protein n=1 Tax=Siminovitchia thermophila TaxID=1245522 RepID=A0ABS2RC82_9BACI|nr:hypothetical protein [Siminovitchia thermophila]
MAEYISELLGVNKEALLLTDPAFSFSLEGTEENENE